MIEHVVLLDEYGAEIGTGEKLATHRAGLLHRAFSVFVFNGAGELLLQRRAAGKYHSGDLWSNTCCGHPRPGEALQGAARRRLREEMGFDCPLAEAFSFGYRAALDGGLVEHELDHVLTGRWEGEPRPDPAEAQAWRWIEPAALDTDLAARPEAYTYWLKACWPRLRAKRG